MGPIRTILFFIGVLYLLVHITKRLIAFLKRKDENREVDEEGVHLDVSQEELDLIFPGGEAQIENETDKLHVLLQKAHPRDLVKLVLVGGAIYFAGLGDKSEEKTIAYVRELSRSLLTAREAKQVCDFVYSRTLRAQLDQ